MKKQIFSLALGLVIAAIGTTTYAADKNNMNSTEVVAKEKAAKDFTKQFKNLINPILYIGKWLYCTFGGKWS